ncbi:MAG: type II toxin-antitoxin system RelE/ParE family toxin [Methylovulum sp.]|nr:type II toxin-antitoxin system RelE/ParE family toxin [Methylovulum sp.]
MSFTVSFHRGASAEFIEASAWYENKRQKLGLEFIAEIERCILLVAERPYQYAVVHKDIRRIVVNRFPYSVYFRVEERRIIVLSVCHSKRDPVKWQDRV